MKIEILTKEDLIKIEAKLEELTKLLQFNSGTAGANTYTSVQLARKLNVSTKTLSNWRRNKLIDYSQVNNKIFYTEAAVQQFICRHTIKRRSSLPLFTSSKIAL